MNIFQRFLTPRTYTESRTGLNFPVELARLKRGEVRPYVIENSEGVTIAYGMPGSTQATIYVYSRSGVSVPDGGNSEFVEAEISETLQVVDAMEANGIYSSVKKYDAQPERLGTHASSQTWAKSAFTAIVNGQFMVSLIYITGFRGQFVKLRLTMNKVENEQLTTILTALDGLLSEQQLST